MFSRIFSHKLPIISFGTSLGQTFGSGEEPRLLKMPLFEWLQPTFPASFLHPVTSLRSLLDCPPFLDTPFICVSMPLLVLFPALGMSPFLPSSWKTPTHPSRPGSDAPSFDKFPLSHPLL